MARKAFAHDAVVAMRHGDSPDALGGAIANAFCGEALTTGQLTVPDGGVARWELRSASSGSLRAEEEDLAAELMAH